MISDESWKDIQALASHYLAIGNESIYLGSKCPDIPWELATECEPGGSHRLEISTSVRFRGYDPSTGLRMSWSFDIEPRSANGKGTYEIDTEGCLRVLALLPDVARAQFRRYLAECAPKVEKRAREYQDAADAQYDAARKLAALGEKPR